MKVYCPRCAQEQISHEVRFCSRCGFVMTGISEIVLSGGIPQHMLPNAPQPPTPRRRGLKQGGGLFLLGALIVPILGVLASMGFPETIVALAAIVFFLGGLLRMIYALIFESGHPQDKTLEETVYQTAQKLLNKQPHGGALPPHQTIPAESYVPPRQTSWRDTNDLEPSSVTDPTTKLLDEKR